MNKLEQQQQGAPMMNKKQNEILEEREVPE